MLISQPLIMLKQRPSWLVSCETFCCLLASLFPKAFFTSVITWSIFVLIFICDQDYIASQYDKPVLASCISIGGILLFFLCVYTYYKTIWVGAGSPLDFNILKLPSIDYISSNPYENTSISVNNDQDDLPEQSRSFPPEPPADHIIFHTFSQSKPYRYCNKCQVWKPDRTHHCSSSGKCILRMDHYCPWFATCIGFRNQKFFIQFLLYSGIYCGYLFLVSSSILYVFFANELYGDGFLSINLVILCILSISFSIALGGFGLFSVYLLLNNFTTIEFQEKRWSKQGNSSFIYEFDERGKKQNLGHIYDIGYKKNWTSIMGNTWAQWLLPIGCTSNSIYEKYNNGVNFEINEEYYSKWCNNLQLQDQLNQQLADYKNRIRAERETRTSNV
ncbi:DHHC palmitoyltransferase-domain-containing protein [Scheffersomyces amazonensis]|uniref:DHHC palmitoyltransferase-domain-containing protein n=1 Tax=Scheffersomyces amazonensis TaxID=1078765 RepID=UPI00315D7A83